MGSGVNWGPVHILKAASTFPWVNGFQPCDFPAAPSSGEEWHQPGPPQAAVTGECFVLQTLMSAASTTGAVSRCV